MPLATIAEVEAIMGPQDYDGSTDLTPYINAADVLIRQAQAYAVDQGFSISNSDWEIVETWVAAHMYCMMNPQFQSESTGGISASYMSVPGPHLMATRYGQMAISLDVSGALNILDKRATAKMNWLGSGCRRQPPLCF